MPFALGSFLVVDGVELVATGAFRAVVGVDTAMPIVKVAEIQRHREERRSCISLYFGSAFMSYSKDKNLHQA